jgi:hypothetical protein
VTPFGWSRSPQWFQAFTRHVAKLCRERGVRIICYLDDFLIMAETEEMALHHTKVQFHGMLVFMTQILISILDFLGLTTNLKKSKMRPAQDREFLGLPTTIDFIYF